MKIGLLGYDGAATGLHDVLRGGGHDVTHRDTPIADLSAFDRVVSFGYRHILSQAVLDTARAPVANLHVSLLPYNRGAHPNFWSWIEDSPKGVTIHEMARGIDTGPVIAQRRVTMNACDHTLRSSQTCLLGHIESLFCAIADDWLSGRIVAAPQGGRGTYHAARDLPAWMTDWDMSVEDAMRRYADG